MEDHIPSVADSTLLTNIHETPTILFKLPLEIRKKIYNYLLSAQHVRNRTSDDNITLLSNRFHYHSKFLPQILRVCRRTHSEALQSLYTENLFVCISARVLAGQPHIKSLFLGCDILIESDTSQVINPKHCAMQLDIVASNSVGNPTRFIMLACEDLSALCRNILRISSRDPRETFLQDMSLSVTINRLPMSPESSPIPQKDLHRLLNPLRILHSLKRLDIHNLPSSPLIDQLRANAKSPRPNDQNVIDNAITLRDASNNLHNQCTDPQNTLTEQKATLDSLNDLATSFPMSYHKTAAVLNQGEYSGTDAVRALNEIRITALANLAETYHSLLNKSDETRLVCRHIFLCSTNTLSRNRQSPAKDHGLAVAYYLVAKIGPPSPMRSQRGEVGGEGERGHSVLCRFRLEHLVEAARLEPGNRVFLEELEDARVGLDAAEAVEGAAEAVEGLVEGWEGAFRRGET